MNSNSILWLKVWGIAITQGAITLTWVIYNLYFTKFLVENFGFSQQLAVGILIIENLLEAIIEPIFGTFSDRQKQKIGTSIPIINIGIILSSALFIAIPIVVIFINPQTIWRWLLPAIAVAWASAMAIFRSPVVALLGNAASKDKLPQAASILTLVSQLIGSFKFDVYGIIVNLGANITFAIGSFSLLIAAACLRFLYPPQISSETSKQSNDLNWKTLFLIGVTGISIGCGLRFFMPTINKILLTEVGQDNIKLTMTLFFIALGLVAIPAGKIANKIGNSQAILIGLLTTTFFLQILVLNKSNSFINLTSIAIICSFSLVLNGAIPFVLNLVPQRNAGLGIGAYFCGFGIAISLFEFIFNKLGEIDIQIGSIGSTIAFLLAFLLIATAKQIYNVRS
jgi:MFS family permease